MKTKGILLTIGLSVLTLTALSQRSSQADLSNEFYAGYGAGSIFYFTGISNKSYQGQYSNSSDKYLRSAGTFYMGYNRTLNRVISLGINFSYMPANTEYYHYLYDYETHSSTDETWTATDNLLGALTRITFSYLNRPMFRIYSAFALGVIVDCGKVNYNGESFSKRNIYPGIQLTMFGVRFGRALGGFLEMGFGTSGIVNAGISYKIKD